MIPEEYEGYEPDDFDAADFMPEEGPQTEVATKKHKDDGPFNIDGIDLSRPPGFVGEVADWIDAQCLYPRRRAAVAMAIASIGNVGGLSHYDPVNEFNTNLFMFCVAGSATGKESVLTASDKIYRAAGCDQMVNRIIKSEQEISRSLIEHQGLFFSIDEFGITLQKIENARSRGGASYLEGIVGTIMNIYGKGEDFLPLNKDVIRDMTKEATKRLAAAEKDGDDAKAEGARKALQMIETGFERPFLSISGFTTPVTFEKLVNGDSAEQGFIGRAVIVTEPDNNPAPRRGFSKAPMPETMKNRLIDLFDCGSYDLLGSRRIERLTPRAHIETDDDAREMLQESMFWFKAYADEMEEATGAASVPVVRRGYEIMAKISLILGMPGRRRTKEHVLWAFAYAKANIDTKIKIVFANDQASERPDEAAAARVMRYLDTDGKGLSLRVLSNRMKMKEDKLQALLLKMQARGMIREQSAGRAYRGKPVTVWVLTEG